MSKLFSPVRIGNTELKHRVVLAPLTRYRADDAHVPLNFVKDYYAQRASTPGTLLITEGTFISPRAGEFANVPGIYNDSQVKAWRELLTEEGIHAFIQDYANAAKLAIEAGFDGVEIHGANGYLCDQFLQDNCNNRTDGWGGSVEKRSRFCLEVAKAVAAAVGGERVGYRMSPWSLFQGMKMENPRPQFTHLAQNLKELGLAYIHVVESRISGAETIDAMAEQADFLVDVWGDAGTVILAGGFTPEETVKKYEGKQVVIAFGRNFLANPDLPFRISQGVSLTKYNRSTFYIPESPVGYIDYPFSEEYLGRKTAVY